MQRFKLTRKEAFESFRELEADHHILLVPGTQRILMANPYSAISTPFRVYVGSRRFFANCAWDSISLHVMLELDARVESFCHHCAKPIEVSLSKGEVKSSKPSSPLIFLSTPVSKWYDNLINTCSNNMVYFSSKDHLNRWLEENTNLRGESLTVENMVDVCRPLSRGRMNLEYQRPPQEGTDVLLGLDRVEEQLLGLLKLQTVKPRAIQWWSEPRRSGNHHDLSRCSGSLSP